MLKKGIQLILFLLGVNTKAIKHDGFLELITGNYNEGVIDKCENKLQPESKAELELGKKVIPTINKIEKKGVNFNFSALHKDCYKDTEVRIDELKNQTQIFRFDGSSDSYKELLSDLRDKGYKVKRAHELDSNMYDNDKFILALRELISLVKKLSYFERLETSSSDGNIRTNFMLYAGSAGRITSYSPSLQNIPKAWKKHIEPNNSGEKPYELDIRTAEVFGLSDLTNERLVFDLLADGVDFYTYTTSQIFNKKEEEVSPELRDTMKKIINGITYGMTGYGIAEALNSSSATKKHITPKLGEQIKSRYFRLYPKFEEYHSKMTETDTLETTLGHKFSVKPSFKNVSFGPQNHIATLMKKVLISLDEKGLVDDVINIVHDSIWISSDVDTLEQIKLAMETEIANFFNIDNEKNIEFVRVTELGGEI